MKKRVISAIVALAIFIPIFIKGGFIYNLAIYILSLLALKEFIEIKETKKKLPLFLTFISYLIMSFIVLHDTSSNAIISLDFRILSALFLVFLVPTLMYSEKNKYSVNDAFYLIGGIFFLGVSFSLLIITRSISLSILTYLFLITMCTDSYAYLFGSLIGKHKLLESISPKKSVEGMLFGTFFGSLIGFMYYYTFIGSNDFVVVIFITIFLSVIGQLGDLVFSGIKRYFNKKDFSNIMPGHGGILDRFDSIIFVLLAYTFFINIL